LTAGATSRSRARFSLLLAIGAIAACGGGAESAIAAPDCGGGPPRVRTLLENQGTLESVIVGGRGRLFFTNEDSLLRLDRPGARARVLARVEEPGGLAFENHKLIVGTGNTAANGSVGDDTGPASLLRIDANSGAKQVYATGLSMANGLVRGPDGSFYASNDFGSNIDRIRNRKTTRGWATVESGNGLAIDRNGRYLYAAQTFRPAAVQRVDLSDPTKVTVYASDTDQPAAGLDGMTRDGGNRLFVAANGAGEIWRVDPGSPARFCALLRGLPPFPDGPSAVATGSPKGRFPATSLYAVTFGGQVLELRNVALPPTPIR
jgi:sugar lactone lactonase YvrE